MGDQPVIRGATLGDVPAIRLILAAHGNDGPVAPGRADIVGPYVRHLVVHHRVLLTELDGAAVAFGAVVDTGITLQLADLFVLPDRLGRGLGRPLLAALFGDAPRRTTFASDDPRALPVYVRAGMRPLWPILYLEGEAAALGDPPAGLLVRDGTPAEVAALELAWTGAGRAADHAFWATQAEADTFVVEDAAGPVAFGYARARQVSPVRAVDRMLVRPDAGPVAPILAGLRRSARSGRVHACVPGPNPALPVLLEIGLRIVDQSQFLASDEDIVDPARLLPNPGML